jgi:hypothetical protein
VYIHYTNDFSFFLLDFSFHKSPEFGMKKRDEKKRNETIISCYARNSSHFPTSSFEFYVCLAWFGWLDELRKGMTGLRANFQV